MRDETKCPQGVAKAEHALHCKCDHYLCWSDMRIQAELARLGPTSEFAARLKAHEALGEKVSCNDPRPGISHDWSCDDVTEVIHGALTRDAEHRAELDAARATIEQLGKDGAALATENERLKGELAEARGLLEERVIRETCIPCGRCITCRTLDFLSRSAPPPAESTPVQATPPDDIRERGVKCECGAGRNHVMYCVCKLAAKTAEDLTFEQFAEVNRRRCESYNGFGESLQLSSQYTEAHWALSIASEAGEVADAILGWSGLKRSKAGKTKEDVGRELADVVTYCDLLASKLGFQLSRLIVAKFNEINERCGFGNRFAIGSHPVQPALEAKDSDRCARADCGRPRRWGGHGGHHVFVSALEAKGEPGTHALGRPGWRTPHPFVPGMWPHADECREETRSPNNESCGLPINDPIHTGAKS